MKESEGKSVVYSALEVANICGVVNQTAINWIRNKHLKAFSTPGGQFRVYPEDLIEFMQSRNMRIPESVLENCSSEVSSFKDFKILVIDDDEGFNNVMVKYIENKFPEAKVFQAFDGFEAGAKMVEKQPKCLVLDLNLPGVDGFKLCKTIYNSEVFGHPEIIVVTALEEDGIEQKCRDLGVRYFLKKPVFVPELLKIISEIFS